MEVIQTLKSMIHNYNNQIKSLRQQLDHEQEETSKLNYDIRKLRDENLNLKQSNRSLLYKASIQLKN